MPTAGDPDPAEYDTWRGSSLGIRIDRRDNAIWVKQVHEHVADKHSLQTGDRIDKIDDLDINMLSVNKLAELLNRTPPGSKMTARITRDDKSMDIELTTYRRPLVDVVDIIDRLEKNSIIKKHLKDTGRSDFFEDATERMVQGVRASQSPREAYETINRIIDEIDVSHTALVPSKSFHQLRGNEVGELGLTLRRHEIGDRTGYFVVDRMFGTPGYESQIKLGDEILGVNGVPIEESARLILSGHEQRYGVFFVTSGKDETVRLKYRRRQNGPAFDTEITAGMNVGPLTVLNQSARVIEDSDNRIGYVRFWNLMSMNVPKGFGELIDDEFSECHAVIIDLRGRGGIIPAVIGVEKVVQRTKVPVIAITDELTRSAKEMLSLRLKKLKNATVIGQKTAGAVTAATFVQLPSGNRLMFPAASAEMLKRFTDGVILEGNGVDPDLHFDFQIPYCGGNDRLLEAAVDVASDQIQELLDTLILR